MDYLFRWLGLKFLGSRPAPQASVGDWHSERGEKKEELETAVQLPLIECGPGPATIAAKAEAVSCAAQSVPVVHHRRRPGLP